MRINNSFRTAFLSVTKQLLKFLPGLQVIMHMCNDPETGASEWSVKRARFVSRAITVCVKTSKCDIFRVKANAFSQLWPSTELI